MSRRPAAIPATLSGAVAIGAGVFAFVDEFPLGLGALVCSSTGASVM